MPILILSGSKLRTSVRGSTTFTARKPQAVRGSVAFTARKPVPVSGHTVFRAVQPTPAMPAALPGIEYHVHLTGLPGVVLAWEYSHSGQHEELSVTVVGQYGLHTPSATLECWAVAGNVTLGKLPARAFQEIGQEPQVDVGANTTQFRFRNSFDRVLRGLKLPEFIPWKLQPSPEACAGTRQSISVSALVQNVLMNATGERFRLEADPLAGSTFEENTRDFSTESLTPQAVWDATYGALGMVLHVTPMGEGIVLVGRWPQPVTEQVGPSIDRAWMLSRQEGRELLHTPAALTVRGADFIIDLTPDRLTGWVGNDAEVGRELSQSAEWYDQPQSSGTTRTWRGYRKQGGQIADTVEFSTADITVRETVDGKVVSTYFMGVGTGYKLSQTTFDPDCPGRPLHQRTVTKAWGYDAHTGHNGFSVTGPGIYYDLTVGDLAADEESLTTYLYSSQGYLSGKVTQTRRLASMQQRDAEAEPAERGPLTGREYVTSVQTESWQPSGGGQWHYNSGLSGQTLMPVYDLESGEAVRTASVIRSSPDSARLTDQAPPSYDCQKCARKLVRHPTGAVLLAGDAGFAEEREVNLSFLSPQALAPVAQLVLTNQWNRVVTQFSLPFPVGYLPGNALAEGLIRELRISQAGDGPITSSLTVARLDTLFGSPQRQPGNLVIKAESGNSIMLKGQPGGAVARVVTGWNVLAAQPLVEQAFVAFRSGFPPRPGEELSWTFVNGRREAHSAR